jgi:hypothetical protein
MLVVYLMGLEGDSTVSLKELLIDSNMKELICCECIYPPCRNTLARILLPKMLWNVTAW